VPAPPLTIRAEGLSKRFGKTQALDGFDLAVPEGTVCGLLGPNGAGKTTAVRILATLLRPDGGRAEVAGFDVARQAEEVRYRIGLTGQHTTMDDILSGHQNLVMFGRLYHLSTNEARQRADELLVRFGLEEAAHKPVKAYSGGMRRRLDLAASFIMAPPVLFLDEPTTGLDPRHRNEVWRAVRSLVAAGTTVLLTTHYLDEADQLADQITVIHAGRVIADDTPERLKATIGGAQVEIAVHDLTDVPRAATILERVCGQMPAIDSERRRLSAPAPNRAVTLMEVVRGLDAADIVAMDLGIRQPTLDEVFIRLTGTSSEEIAA
jgi:ABC-2 type transport system ATP-binding protein